MHTLFDAILVRNVLETLYTNICYADLVRHKVCTNKHLIVPSGIRTSYSLRYNIPHRYSVFIYSSTITIALRHRNYFANSKRQFHCDKTFPSVCYYLYFITKNASTLYLI